MSRLLVQSCRKIVAVGRNFAGSLSTTHTDTQTDTTDMNWKEIQNRIHSNRRVTAAHFSNRGLILIPPIGSHS